MARYEEVRRDYEFLYSIAELDDCVEMEAEFWNLMQNPTKAEAARLYEAGIRLWFGEHGRRWPGSLTEEIADRYGIEC